MTQMKKKRRKNFDDKIDEISVSIKFVSIFFKFGEIDIFDIITNIDIIDILCNICNVISKII